MAAGRVQAQIATDETEVVDGAVQFLDGSCERVVGHLRKLCGAGKVLRVQVDDAPDQVVIGAGPVHGQGGVAYVMRHCRGPGREDRQVRTAFAQQSELILLDAFADLVIADPRLLG